eukprot:UN07235
MVYYKLNILLLFYLFKQFFSPFPISFLYLLAHASMRGLIFCFLYYSCMLSISNLFFISFHFLPFFILQMIYLHMTINTFVVYMISSTV